jgi:Tol biopolymer transport system component
VEPEHQDWEGKQVQKIVNVGPLRPHGNDWYSTGTGSPRWVVRTFSGVSFSPDGHRLVYCSDQAEGGQFMLYTIPVSGGEATPVPGSATAWPAETDWGPG